MKKPKLFKPTQKDLERIGKKIAANLSPDKKVIAGKKEIRGEKTTSADFLKMDLQMQSGSIWTDEKKGNKKKEYVTQNLSGMILKPDPVKYGGKKIYENLQIIE